MAISHEQLASLIAGGEGDKVKFKQSTAAMDGIARAVCAQANSLSGGDGPGYVIVGVADNGAIVGIDASDREQQKLAQVRLDGKTQPTPNMTLQIFGLEGRDVAVLEVGPSSSPPVRCGGVAYVRIGSTTGKATPDEERQLVERRRILVLPFDARGIAGTSRDDLDLPLFYPEGAAIRSLSQMGKTDARNLCRIRSGLRRARFN